MLKQMPILLSQKQEDSKYHPVAYASTSLLPNELKYPISELQTVIGSVEYFCTYLLGRPCTVLTDHISCFSLLNTTKSSAKFARWAMAIQEMNLEIQHRPGRSNVGADGLSRSPCDTTTVNSVTTDSSECTDGH